MPLKLFVAMPLHNGSLPWQTAASLNSLMSEPPGGVEITFKLLQGESNIVEARNCLTAAFLRSDCESVLFVDADMVFRPWQVGRIASHLQPVVGGIYCKKVPGTPDYCCQGLEGQTQGVPNADGLIEVSKIATGFLCLHRSVFDLVERDLRPVHYHGKHGEQVDFWNCELHAHEGKLYYQGEDWSFCERLRRLQVRLYADARVLLGHVGTMVFPDKAGEFWSGEKAHQ